MVLIVFIARRLKDIEANQLFAGLPLIPLFFWVFLKIERIHDTYLLSGSFLIYPSMIVIAIIPSFLLMFLFLLFRKGISDNVFSKKRKGMMRQNTLIITVCFLSVISIPIGIIIATEYQLYSSRKVAMRIVEALDKFETEKGYYPEKLEELVPNYIDKIPNNKGRLFVSEDFSYNLINKGKCENKPFYWIIIHSEILTYNTFSSSKRVWTE